MTASYSIYDFVVDLKATYIDDMENRQRQQFPGETSATGVDAIWYFDVSAAYTWRDSFTFRVGLENGKFVPVVFAGPVISVLLSATEEEELTGGDSESFDVKQYFKSTDFGLDFGARGEFALGKMKALIDFRYYMGLTNVYSAPPIMMAALMEFTMKNAAFMLTAGLIF